ncbi:MAG: hypothetical protein WEE50_05290 [Chloroflexota bacterium]
MSTEAAKADQPLQIRASRGGAPSLSGPLLGDAQPMVYGTDVPLTESGIEYLQRTAGNASVVDLLARHVELSPLELPGVADRDRPATEPLGRPKSLRLAGSANEGVRHADGLATPLQRHAKGATPSFDKGAAESAVNSRGEPAAAPAAVGGGRRPARLPNRAMDVATAEAALNGAYGTVHTMTRPPIKIVSKRELLRAYDKYCIDNSVPYTNPRTGTTRPWRRGDADRSIEGFALPDGSAIYVQKNTVLPTATAHEMLHANTAADFRAAVGEAINEGTTEHLAIKAVAAAGLPTVGRSGAKAYVDQVGAVGKLITVVGEATLIAAYFGGADSLVKAYEALMPSTFAALKGAGMLDTAHMAALLVPRTPAQKTALVNGRLSASTTAADIAAIQAICASDAADVPTIAAGVAANLETAVRTKVVEQTAASLGLATDLAGLPIASVSALRTAIGPDIGLLVMAKLLGSVDATAIADATALAELPFADRDGLALSVSGAVAIQLAMGLHGLETVTKLGNLPFADKTALQTSYSPTIVTWADELLDGWVSDADLDQIGALCNLPITNRSTFAATLRPRASELNWGQRMRLRLMLDSP